ncbi:hypothetical protein, partial [Streptomyces sp. NPDC002403]
DGLTWGPHDAQESLTLFHNYTGDHYNGSHTPADQNPPTPAQGAESLGGPGLPAPPDLPGVRVEDLGQHGTAHLPTIEDLTRTTRQLAAANNHLGVHLHTLAGRLGLEEGVIRGVLAAHGITVKPLGLRFDGKQLNRLGVRVEDLGQHGLAGGRAQELPAEASDEPGRTAPQEATDPDSPNQTHHPASPPLTIEDIARTIRQLAGERVGVHLDALAAHLRQTQDEIRRVIEANGISVKPLELWFGGERRKRLGVRVDALGGHGTAHLPAIEDLTRAIRQLAGQQKQAGVHLAALATRLGRTEAEIRNVLEANGIAVQKLRLWFGGKRLNRLGVRAEDLGLHGLAENGAGELPRDTSDESGRTAPQETTEPASPNQTHHPAPLPPTAEQLTRTPHEQAAPNHQSGMHPTNHAPHPDRPAETTPRATTPTPPTPLPAPQTTTPGTISDRIFAALNPTAAQDSSTDLPPAPQAENDQPGTPTGKRKRDTRKNVATDQNPSKRRRRGIPPSDQDTDQRDTPGPGPSLDTSLPEPRLPQQGTNQPDYNHNHDQVVGVDPGLAPLALPDTDEQNGRTAMTRDLLGPSQAHHPASPTLTIEDLARTIREMAAERERGVWAGVHLDALAAHLGRTEAEIRNVLKANGITVQPLDLQVGGERRKRLGVRVKGLGQHGLAHLPTIEKIDRTIRQLAAANNHLGVHLRPLATHLRLQEFEIRYILEANGTNVQSLELLFGGERRQWLGVRVEDLGGHGIAHLPTIEDLARTIRQLAGERTGVHLEPLATHLRRTQAEIRNVLEANGITVQYLDVQFDGKRRSRLGVRVKDLGRHGIAHLPTIEDLARTIRQLAGERTGVHLEPLATHLRRTQAEIRNVLEANGITVRKLNLRFGSKQHNWVGVRVEDLGRHGRGDGAE